MLLTPRPPRSIERKHRHKLVNLLLLLLQNTFANPHQISNLLLLQLDVRIKRPKVHLSLERQLQHLHVPLVECIVNGLAIRSSRRVHVPNGGILGEQFQHAAEFVLVPHIGQHGRSRGVQVAQRGIEAFSIRSPHGRLVERRPKRVERNVNRVGIGTDLEKVAHNGSRLPPEAIDIIGKVLNPIFNEAGFDNFYFHLFEDVGHLAPHGRLLQKEGEVRSDGGIDQDSLVEILVAAGSALEGGDGSHGALLEHSEGVALGDEFVDVAATEGTLEEEHDVFDHVFVGDEVEEGGEGFDGLGAQILEFAYQLLHGRLLQSRRNQGIHIRQRLGIIRLAQI
mmetsp:Transcript_316/g.590  ORF Transcript_316/g.590 Transcript_316/m.590 type:complete len:337 (-) Transcript_316:267-1277(-)